MATATYRQVIDGEVYEVGDTLPEMGSLKVLENNLSKVIYVEGLKADADKLPTWAADGSKALFTDTGELYTKTNGTWGEMG